MNKIENEEEIKPEEEEKEEEISDNSQATAVFEDECDFTTMDCSKMPEVMEDMIKEDLKIESKLDKLETIKQDFPEIKQVDEIRDNIVKRKEEISTNMNTMVERFSTCRPPEAPEKKPEIKEKKVEDNEQS